MPPAGSTVEEQGAPQLLAQLDSFAFSLAQVPSTSHGQDLRVDARIGSSCIKNEASFQTQAQVSSSDEVGAQAETATHTDSLQDMRSEKELHSLVNITTHLSSSSCETPPLWREQLREILSTGARGTVEDFHAFLVGLHQLGADGHFLSLCASMLSAQTRDLATLAAVQRLCARYGTGDDQKVVQLESIIGASIDDIEECLKGVNYHKTKAKHLQAIARAVSHKHGGVVPSDFASLTALPGIGTKVANLIRAVTFSESKDCGMIVDTHVHRVAGRLGWTDAGKANTPEHTRRRLEEFIPDDVREVFTRRVIAFGQEICLPQRPRCKHCPLAARGLCPTYERQRVEAQPKSMQRCFANLLTGARGTKRVIELD